MVVNGLNCAVGANRLARHADVRRTLRPSLNVVFRAKQRAGQIHRRHLASIVRPSQDWFPPRQEKWRAVKVVVFRPRCRGY